MCLFFRGIAFVVFFFEGCEDLIGCFVYDVAAVDDFLSA